MTCTPLLFLPHPAPDVKWTLWRHRVVKSSRKHQFVIWRVAVYLRPASTSGSRYILQDLEHSPSTVSYTDLQSCRERGLGSSIWHKTPAGVSVWRQQQQQKQRQQWASERRRWRQRRMSHRLQQPCATVCNNVHHVTPAAAAATYSAAVISEH